MVFRTIVKGEMLLKGEAGACWEVLFLLPTDKDLFPRALTRMAEQSMSVSISLRSICVKEHRAPLQMLCISWLRQGFYEVSRVTGESQDDFLTWGGCGAE